MDEVDDLYGDLLAFDDELLPLETPKAGEEGKKRKAAEMLVDGGGGGGEVAVAVEQQRPSLATEPSIPPGLEQGAKRENFQKAAREKATAAAVPKKETTCAPVLESKPSEVSERAIVPMEYNSQPPKYVRYFILKSNNMPNLRRSVENAVWATQPHNEGKLNEAYHTTDEVRLIFSVNQSGHFQGYARMSSPIGRGPKHGFWVGSSWGGLFQVEWEVLYNLPFHKVEHLSNPLNEGKPVKIAKDGQEVPVDIAKELLRLMREGAKAEGMQKPEPQQRLYVDPAPYFGPTRESLRRQAYANQNAGRMGGPESFMGSGPPVEHFSPGGMSHGGWRGGFRDRMPPGMDGVGMMGTPMEIRSGVTCSGPSSREPQEFDVPTRGPSGWSGSERRYGAAPNEPQHSKSPQKSEGIKEVSPTLVRGTKQQSEVPCESRPSPTAGDDMDVKSEKEGSAKSLTNGIGREISEQPAQADRQSKQGGAGGKDSSSLHGNGNVATRKRDRSPGMTSNPTLPAISPRERKKRKHLFELTYEEYLDQYYKFQDRLRDMISSGALWRLLGMGGSNGDSGAGAWSDANGTGSFGGNFGSSGGAKSGGGGHGAGGWFNDKVGSTASVNKPMLESEYVEYCRRFCGFHGFSFDESKVREYYHRMRVQYESMRAQGQGAHGSV